MPVVLKGSVIFADSAPAMKKNTLYYGDNLDVLQRHVKDESVDLVYLDPPFNSDRDYNLLFKEQDGTRSAAQIKAFEDMWRWDEGTSAKYSELVEAGGPVALTLDCFRTFLGESNMLAYVTMMAPRLVELRRVLKPTGSLYLHCDPAASHYLKMLLDRIFGPDQFRNEIVWRRNGSHNARRTFGPIHDTILFYSKTKDYTFNIVRRPYSRNHVAKRYKPGPDGRLRFTSGGNVLTGAGVTAGDSCNPWRGFDPAKKGRHWAVPGFYEAEMPSSYARLKPTEKLEALFDAGLIEIEKGKAWPTMIRYLDEREGVPVQDIWAYQPHTEGLLHGTEAGIDADVAWMGPTDPKRIGYPTQKPDGLLERIITAGSNPGDVVLDPFCGCGTATDAAHSLGRKWIGIDITHLAVSVIKNRLLERHDLLQDDDYEVVGEPTTLSEARILAKDDTHQFEHWALGLVNARASAKGKGADGGLDGWLGCYVTPGSLEQGRIVVSVKSGKNVGVGMVRDLGFVVDREKAVIGVLILMAEPTKPMRTEAAQAGGYVDGWGERHPKLQILTVKQLLDAKRPAKIDAPPTKRSASTKAA